MSLLVARVKFEPVSSHWSRKIFCFFFISFVCDSSFHNDVQVVNSKIIKQSGLRSRSIDLSRGHSNNDSYGI